MNYEFDDREDEIQRAIDNNPEYNAGEIRDDYDEDYEYAHNKYFKENNEQDEEEEDDD